jgi:RNA polymerase sigma factor (sigma-70 family)
MNKRVKQFMNLNDAVLIEKYSHQDEESADAFEALIKHHEPKAVQIFHHYFHDADEEHDAMLAVELKVMEKIISHKYVDNGNFWPYFKKAVNRESIDRLKRRKKFPHGEATDDILNEQEGNDVAVNRYETYHDLDEAEAGMKDIYRIVFNMYYYQEMTLEEIAEELEIPLGTACSRFERAKEYLRHFYTAIKNAKKNERND